MVAEYMGVDKVWSIDNIETMSRRYFLIGIYLWKVSEVSIIVTEVVLDMMLSFFGGQSQLELAIVFDKD